MEKPGEKIYTLTRMGLAGIDSIVSSCREYSPSLLLESGIGEQQFLHRKKELAELARLASMPRNELIALAASDETDEARALFGILSAAHNLDAMAFTREECSPGLTDLFIRILLHFRCHIATIYTLSGACCGVKTISVNGMSASHRESGDAFMKSKNACAVLNRDLKETMFGTDFAGCPCPGKGDELAVCVDDNIIILVDDISYYERTFSMHELSGLMLIAGYIKSGISERRDPGTGMLNMNAYYENRRNGFHSSGCFLVADADDFGKIKTAHGREFAQFVLMMASDMIKGLLGHSDRVYRMGGDEFLIWINGGDGDSIDRARNVANSIIKKIASSTISRHEKTCTATFSIGMAELVRSPGSAAGSDLWRTEEEYTIELADRALYTAKHTGKNRVEPHV